MKKALYLVLTVVALGAMGLAAWGCGSASAADSVPGSVYIVGQDTGISVTGVGEVIVVNDLAMLNVGVQTQAASVAEAQQQAAQAMADIESALKADGVAGQDIATSGYSVYPQYSYDQGISSIVGYSVTNSVSVKIRKIDDTGKIIDDVTAAGGDATRINGISFTVDDSSKYNEEARALAMADAQARAEQLAELGGVQLGRPSYITESGGYSAQPPVYVVDMAVTGAYETTTPISAGETSLSISVQVVYNIQ